jgi:hypothetical protein
VIHSPAEIAAAWPTKVTSSRWPRALTRTTQKPFLGVLVSDALDQSGEHLVIGWCGLVLHDGRHTPAVISKAARIWWRPANRRCRSELCLEMSISMKARLVVCDLSASPYIDLAGARMLHRLHDELASRGITLRIVGARGRVRDLLRADGIAEKIRGLDRVVTLDSLLGGVGK